MDDVAGATGRDRLTRSPQERLRRWLWRDDDLADAEADARKREKEREGKLLLKCPQVVADGNRDNVKAALELAESVVEAETERETNLNARGAAVAIATALAKPIFATSDSWAGTSRKATEYLFLIALVSIASAMVMAVVGVLRPRRGGQTKNAVGEAVVNVWRQDGGDIALAGAAQTQIAAFQLDRLLRAILAWHYRNRSKARWLRRAWMFLMLGIILIGSAGVILLTELSEITWEETVVVIAAALVVIWLSLRRDLVGAGRDRKQAKDQDGAMKEAAEIVRFLGSPALAATEPAVRLRKLQELRDVGLLSLEEYEVRRDKVFNSI